ncbi:hypothetical protein SH203_01936 [Brevundimonas sp. SH203]|uniref:hypothetical protein n=1 Tax=Brevundimonas sp. SH203 TaxID=345167 RepID=UPI0009CB01B0|nr:hypothetical protein [Brevundimonas sp. SH203]GAW41528.1 hypothetical protein SH203_01936 [Brevundimonas sp. SH203]
MLYWIESFEKVTKLPFEDDYRRWIKDLDSTELSDIRTELNKIFDSSEIETSSWIPGGDWEGTVYQAIYEKPAQRNPEIAARIFGLIVFKVAMDRTDKWVTGRFELNGEAIRGRTYFRPGNPDILPD